MRTRPDNLHGFEVASLAAGRPLQIQAATDIGGVAVASIRRSLPLLNASPTNDWVPTEVHDWKGTEKDILVLNYTLACPLRCDFCCYGCHPKRTEQTMPLEEAVRLVREAAEIEAFSSVGFTGGEALLFPDEILTITRTAGAVGLGSTIATACHWAESPEAAREILEPLADAGLYRLNVSHDPSHARFVPSRNVENAARCAADLGIDTYIVGTFFSPDESLQDLLPGLDEHPRIKYVNKFVAKVGRASKRDITQETYGLSLELEGLACYRRVHHDLVVFWDGAAYPCCSTFNRSTPGIMIGNAFDESLHTIWTRAEGSLLFRIMKRQGFSELYKVIKRYDPGLYKLLPDASAAVGPCSLCNSIFGTPDLADRVVAAINSYEIDRVSGAIDALEQTLGTQRITTILDGLVGDRPLPV